jgi:pimeloyl-ACP methyl ester carboxylesterase
MVVVIAGFLTEKVDPSEPDEWAAPVVNFARARDFGAASVQWGSRSFTDIFTASGELKSLALGALAAWSEARAAADALAEDVPAWLGALGARDVHVLGHSLGGRVALKACAHAAPNSIATLTALAPACRASDCAFPSIIQATRAAPTVYFSAHDQVLANIFPTAESPSGVALAAVDVLPTKWRAASLVAQALTNRLSEPALGLTGQVPQGVEALDASRVLGVRVGHFTYLERLGDILASRF